MTKERMDNILNTILINTYTGTQLKHRILVLKTYLEQQFFAGQTQKSLNFSTDPWIKTLPPTLLAQFNKDNLSTIFESLQTEIQKIQPLTLYLTFDPDEQTTASIGEFARKTFGSSIILDIKYNPNLIAGASIVWKGIYKDYSLKSKIEEKKTEVLQSFKQFLR